MEDKSKGLSKSHSGASYRDSIHMYSVLGVPVKKKAASYQSGFPELALCI